MKKKTKFGIAGILSATALAASSFTVMAADVDVYAEGAYTDTDLVVYIYADINTDPLVSAGVQLAYDNSKLTLASAQKNETDWYFGTSTVKYPYQEPQDTGSAVIFLCGKIDEDVPTAGVEGTRKLVGKAIFTRSESAKPGMAPETYFGTSLGLGIVRTDGEFANFVTNGESVLDNLAGGIDFSHVIIRERGDANGDYSITPADMLTVRNAYYASAPLVCRPAADCNADENITPADMLCIRNKYYAP
jgi:hypothetical protein